MHDRYFFDAIHKTFYFKWYRFRMAGIALRDMPEPDELVERLIGELAAEEAKYAEMLTPYRDMRKALQKQSARRWYRIHKEELDGTNP